MQYFTIQARSNREAIEKMKITYGEDARILTHRGVRLGGFLGLFSSEGVEVTGYLSEDGGRKRKAVVQVGRPGAVSVYRDGKKAAIPNTSGTPTLVLNANPAP